MKIKCLKSICMLDQKPGLMQVFYRKDGSITSARIRHYIGTVSGKPKFSYCSQSVAYAETQLSLGQKPLIESIPSKAVAIGENQRIDHNGQVYGLANSSSNLENKSNPICAVLVQPGRTSASQHRVEYGKNHCTSNKKDVVLVNIQSIDWLKFEEYVKNKYAKSTQAGILCYARKYTSLLNDVKGIELQPKTIQNNIIEALNVLSCFLGYSTEYKEALKSYGIKKQKQNAVTSFNRIFNATGNQKILDEWESKANLALNKDEKQFLKFCKLSGLRKDECINSWNLIIYLKQQGKLDSYYCKPYQCLMHFRFEKMFLRGKKNCFLTFIDETSLNEIANSGRISYSNIRKRLAKAKLPIKIKLYRNMFPTFLMQHQISESECNLMQGRVKGVLIQHYWSPELAKLATKVLNAFSEQPQQPQPQEPNKYVVNVSDKTRGYISFNVDDKQ